MTILQFRSKHTESERDREKEGGEVQKPKWGGGWTSDLKVDCAGFECRAIHSPVSGAVAHIPAAFRFPCEAVVFLDGGS